MIQIFANRAELMPVGETPEEHKQWQDEEAALVERDRSSRVGLFRGCFRMLTRRPITLATPIRDDEDNVDRCPRCTWELEDGQCGSCGYHVEDAGSSGSEGPEYYHPDEVYDMEHAVNMDDALLEAFEEANADEFWEQHDSDDDYPPPSYIRRSASRNVHPRLPSNDYDSLPDTDDGSGDDEDVDSINSFVVADEEQPSTASSNRSASHSTTSSLRSLNWETEDRTAVGGIQESDDDHDSQQNSEASEHEASSPVSLYDHGDESDEGPVPPSRRQVFRFSSDSDESASTEFSQVVATILQDRARRRRSPGAARGVARHQRDIPHRARESEHSNGTPRTIEMESDSEPPMPNQRRRRNRAIHTRLSSDDDTNAEASSGTATVGRQSPRLGPRIQTAERHQGSQACNTASPTVTALSSAMSASVEDEDTNQPLIPTVPSPLGPISDRSQSALLAISPRSPHERYERTRRPPTDANHGTYSSPQNHATLHHSAYPGQPSTNQQRRRNHLYSLSRPRHGRNSPAVRLSNSPLRSDGRPGQSARDRRAQKLEKRAERERLKAERELRSSA